MLGGQIINAGTTPAAFSSLWATSSLHLNDSEEFARGKALVDQALGGLPKGAVRRTMKLGAQDSDAMEVFCSCFSAIDDDLSQWRGYGDNGAGVCLEFGLDDLLMGINGVGYWVVYGKPDSQATQLAVARDLVSYIHASIKNILPNSVPHAVYKEIREQLTEIWPALFLAFKHSAFRAEEEFRIVYSSAIGHPQPTLFRPSPMIPFVKLSMLNGKPLPVRSIRLGPAVSSEVNVRSLRLALDGLGLMHIDVRKSEIPYVPR